MFAAEFSPITIPSWVNRVALPKYPFMPFAGYILLGLGASILLIGYFTPIKKLLSLLAGLVLLAYYPLAYLAHWFLFRFDEAQRSLHEPSKFEEFLFHHTLVLDWSLLSVCAFLGLVFFVWTVWATIRKRWGARETASPEMPVAVQPAKVRPAPPPRAVPKKPPAPPSSGDPFHFT
jgi:hypothetical protein